MTGFAQVVERGVRQSFVWRGRASRAEYWWFILFGLLCNAVLAIVTRALGSTPVMSFLAVALNLALFFPILAVGVRRLHDTDRSGYWSLLWLTPLVGVIVLVFVCLRGDSVPNRYGPPTVTAVRTVRKLRRRAGSGGTGGRWGRSR